MVWLEAQTIINAAAVKAGLEAATSPFDSTDANFIRLRTLLDGVGRRLVRAGAFSHLLREYTFDTTLGEDSYALPTDFGRLLDDTVWNRTTRIPLSGPVSAERWQAIVGQSLETSSPLYYRIWQGLFWVSSGDSTPADNTIAYEYLTRYWVQTGILIAPGETGCSANTDRIHLEPDLVIAALRLAFEEAIKVDTTAALNDYEEEWRLTCEQDRPGETLPLTPSMDDMSEDATMARYIVAAS